MSGKERNPKHSTCKWFAVCQLAIHNKAKEVAVIQHDKKVKWIERNRQSNDWRNLAAIDFSSVGRREWRLSDRALVKLILRRLWHIFLGLVCKSFFLFSNMAASFLCAIIRTVNQWKCLIGFMTICWLIKWITNNPTHNLQKNKTSKWR